MIFTEFLSGFTAATFVASGVFFLKFWLASRDRFFLLFSSACWLLAIERAVVVYTDLVSLELWSLIPESSIWVYLIRLAAFIMIIIAIWEKNRSL